MRDGLVAGPAAGDRRGARRERSAGCALTRRLAALLASCFLAVSCTESPPQPTTRGTDSEAAEGSTGGGMETRIPAGGSVTGARDAASAIDDPWRLRNLAKLHADRDSREGFLDAVEFLRRLVELEPAVASDRLNFAKALLFAEDYPACDRELAIARRLFADDAPPDLDYVGGLSRKRQNDYLAAEERFARATAQIPGHEFPWFHRGHAQELLNRFADAEASYRRLLEVAPRHRAGAYRLAMVLRRMQRAEETKRALEFFETLPDTGKRDNEKCDLTAVTLRPFARKASEAPRVDIAWRDATSEFLGAMARGGSRVRPIALGKEREHALAIAGAGGVVLRRLGGGDPVPLDGPIVPPLTTAVEDLLVCDLENDDLDDIVVVSDGVLRVYRGREDGRLAATSTSIETAGVVVRASAWDTDHDGDLDLVSLERTPAGLSAAILRNNGDGSFTRFTPFDDFAPADGSAASMDAHDVDQANDLDVAFAAAGHGVSLYLNRRDGTFARVALPELGERAMVLVEDFDNDGAPDVFAAGGIGGWALARNADRLGSPYELRLEAACAVESPDVGEILDACLGDVDNDGDVDVILATAAGVLVLRNVEGGRMVEDPVVPVTGGSVSTIGVADLDGDCALEILAGVKGRDLVVLARSSPSPYAGWVIRPHGGKDNLAAIGAVVEQFASDLYQSRMIKTSGGQHLGLGRVGHDRLDGVRVRWPQGIIQTMTAPELVPSAFGEVRFQQKKGLVASCPFRYVLSPDGWTFVTDVLGLAPLDEWRPPNVAAAVHEDPEEFVRIDGGLLAIDNGTVRVAVTEELRETAYLDRLELIAIDHPADRDVWIDESTRQPAYGPLDLIVVPRAALSPLATLRINRDTHGGGPGPRDTEGSASEGPGVDVTGLVQTIDGRYVHGYPPAPSQWGGWVERYGLDLTVAAPARALLLTGRIAWYDSTVIYALSQHGRTWGPLRLERLGPDGGVTTIVDDLGVPAGMDRTLVALLPETLPVGTQLRLSGQHRLLWDRILVASEIERIAIEDDPSATQTLDGGPRIERHSRAVRRARLGFHGLSRIEGDRSQHEQTYRPDASGPDDTYVPAVGFATRYGEVGELLQSHDDLLVVLVTGDRVEVEFDAPPPSRSGFRRTWFLRVSGWAKEASFHNPTGREVEPLPYRAMRHYPPSPAEARNDDVYRAYLQSFQQREVRRRTL